MRVQQIATMLHLHEEYVRQLIREYNDQGLASLRVRAHPGRKSVLTPEEESVVVEMATMPPQAAGQPFNQWSLRKLTDYLVERRMIPKVSHVTVGRVLERHKVSYQRTRTWKKSTDPDFTAKKTNPPPLPAGAEELGRSLLRRTGAGVPQTSCWGRLGAAQASRQASGHLPP